MEVDNSWILESELGAGGFGIVQLWRNTRDGEEIAIKICKPGAAELNPRQNERWIDEISIMSKLQHPNIVSTKPLPDMLKKNIYPSSPVLCMEYCRKGDLRRVLNETKNWCGLKEPVAIQAMKDIAAAVKYLHSHKLTHRDLKPENVVLQQINDKVVYKLIDLGYAKPLGHDSIYASIVGTLNYVAPELLWKQKYTCSVDYWSLGILFYEIITGSRPFLPDAPNAIIWRKHIERKSYEDICAEYVNGDTVVFRQNIQDPTHLSPCIRGKMVNWFRSVLQWESKQRGRERRENGTDEIIVFTMLDQILSKKVVHVFSVPHYQIYSYLVDATTNLNILQLLIEKDTQINISSQELINNYGVVISNNSILKDTFLTLFRKEGTTQLASISGSDLPPILGNMVERSKVEFSHNELKRCYSAAMFFVKKEYDLFKYYIMALSMKIDLINSRFDTLLSKNCEMISGIDLLNKESYSINELLQSDIINGHSGWQIEIQKEIKKSEVLSETVNDLKLKCNQFLRIRDTLRDFANGDWMTEYQELLEDVQDIVDNCKTLPSKQTYKPIRMSKQIVKFLKVRQTQMKNVKLGKIESQIGLMTIPQVKKELLKLEKFVDSAIALTTIHRKKISNLYKMWQNGGRAAPSDINTESMDVEINSEDIQSPESSVHGAEETASVSADSVIYDNLVIRYMMHDVISDTYETFLQIMNLDP